MFLQLSVSHSVHRGQGVGFPACTRKGGLASQHALGRGYASRGRGSASRGVGRPPRDTWDTMAYDQRAGGTHPAEMHSCFLYI